MKNHIIVVTIFCFMICPIAASSDNALETEMITKAIESTIIKTKKFSDTAAYCALYTYFEKILVYQLDKKLNAENVIATMQRLTLLQTETVDMAIPDTPQEIIIKLSDLKFSESYASLFPQGKKSEIIGAEVKFSLFKPIIYFFSVLIDRTSTNIIHTLNPFIAYLTNKKGRSDIKIIMGYLDTFVHHTLPELIEQLTTEKMVNVYGYDDFIDWLNRLKTHLST